LASLKAGDNEGACKALTAAANSVSFADKDKARKTLAEIQ